MSEDSNVADEQEVMLQDHIHPPTATNFSSDRLEKPL